MSKINIDITEIINTIPHRYPFLLVDRIVEINLNHSIIGIKNITFNEPQFTGHFPQRPIMPGVLIIEALAQLSAVLVAKSKNFQGDREVYLTSIESAKFRKIVTPGDTMHLYSKIDQCRGPVWKFTGVAKVEDNIVAESSFTAMVK